MTIWNWISNTIGMGDLLELGAIIVAAITIHKSVKQDLFEKRMGAYIYLRILLENYQRYITKIDNHGDPDSITIRERYEWLTNSKEFRNIEDALKLENLFNTRKDIDDTCIEMAVRAEEISLLWNRKRKTKFAKISRDFIRLYAQLLMNLAKAERCTVRYNKVFEEKVDSLQKIPTTKTEISTKIDDLTTLKVKMLSAIDAASDADDRLSELYYNTICKQTEKKWWQFNKNKELIGLIKDSIRP